MWRDGGTLETIILTPHAHTSTSLRLTPHWLTVSADRRRGRRPRGSIEPRRRPLSENSSTAECGALLMLMLTLRSREAVPERGGPGSGSRKFVRSCGRNPKKKTPSHSFISQKASSHNSSHLALRPLIISAFQTRPPLLQNVSAV